MQDELYNVDKACKAQLNFCLEKELPLFAPLNGECWGCHKNIYKPYEIKGANGQDNFIRGISVESAGKRLITGCPHCFKSYCD